MLFDAFQVTYNILDQSIADIINTLKAQQKKIIIKEAIANGRLLPNQDYPHYNKLYSTIQQLANTYKVGVDAIALRFCLDSLRPTFVLSGAANQKHLDDNLKANTFQLHTEEIKTLQGLKSDVAHYWIERKKLSWN